MIPVPDSSKVVRNESAERMLGDKARGWIEGEERTPGLHASDLLDPMQAYWQVVDPQPFSDRQITMFLVGKVLHAFVLGAVAGTVDLATSDTGSSYDDVVGISFSPDARLVDGKVAELKTSRGFYEPKDVKDISLYLEQLLVYMVATGTTESQLWVLYLNLRDQSGKTAPAFRCYDFTISPADLVATRTYLLEEKSRLAEALATRNPGALPLCRPFKCGAGNCVWYPICKPKGRYGDPAWDGTAPPKRKGLAKRGA